MTRPLPTVAPPITTPAFVVGHVDFRWTGDARAPGVPELAAHPRVLHTVLMRAPGPTAPTFRDYRRSAASWRALCGVEILAVTCSFFDDAARWSCRRCSGIMNRWLDDSALIRWDLEVPIGG